MNYGIVKVDGALIQYNYALNSSKGSFVRKKIDIELRLAMKSQNKERLSTLRLVTAAIKDRDIAVRTEENSLGVNDEEIIQILTQMIKQRKDSISYYEEAGRVKLAESENSEIAIIKEFLPKQLSDFEIEIAIKDIINLERAESIRDMGRVMGKLKEKYTGRVDFSVIAPMVKKILSKPS